MAYLPHSLSLAFPQKTSQTISPPNQPEKAKRYAPAKGLTRARETFHSGRFCLERFRILLFRSNTERGGGWSNRSFGKRATVSARRRALRVLWTPLFSLQLQLLPHKRERWTLRNDLERTCFAPIVCETRICCKRTSPPPPPPYWCPWERPPFVSILRR